MENSACSRFYITTHLRPEAAKFNRLAKPRLSLSVHNLLLPMLACLFVFSAKLTLCNPIDCCDLGVKSGKDENRKLA